MSFSSTTMETGSEGTMMGATAPTAAGAASTFITSPWSIEHNGLVSCGSTANRQHMQHTACCQGFQSFESSIQFWEQEELTRQKQICYRHGDL